MRKILTLVLLLSFSLIHIGGADATIKKPSTAKSKVTIKYTKKPLPLKARQMKAKYKKASRGETTADAILRRAASVLGTPYSFGSTGNSSFDCSGFTSYAYKAAGIDLPHSSGGQASLGSHVDRDSLQKGDLLFFENSDKTRIGHVGIYIGNNNFVHASTSKGVTVTSLGDDYYNNRYVGARRILK